jgi:polysaccharide biosynthesis transport protein
VINQVDLAKHVRYGYGDYGYYYSRYRSYYGAEGRKRKSASRTKVSVN